MIREGLSEEVTFPLRPKGSWSLLWDEPEDGHHSEKKYVQRYKVHLLYCLRILSYDAEEKKKQMG